VPSCRHPLRRVGDDVDRGRIVTVITGAACLLWVGGSAPGAGEGLPAEAAQPVSAGTEQPDLSSFERRVEGIRQGPAALDRIEGAYAEGDRTVTYVAFVEGALPIVVAEQWAVGAQGRGEAVFHFAHGDLLRYRSRARGLAKFGAPSDGWYERTMTIYFAPGRFVAGTGAVNAGRPSRTSTRSAPPGARPRRSRRASPPRAPRARCRRIRTTPATPAPTARCSP
jgi:hypothetical protein